MAGKDIVTINGRQYDARTGKPVTMEPQSVPRPQHQPQAPQAQHKPHRAFSDISGPVQHQAAPAKPHTPRQAGQEVRSVHKQLQKSQTLRRSGLHKPTPVQQLAPVPIEDNIAAPAPKQPTDYHRSPTISKFGPNHTAHFGTMATKSAEGMTQQPHKSEAVRQHPVVAKALANRPVPAQPVERSPRELKEALIRERMAEAKPQEHAHHAEHHKRRTSQPRLATILTSSLALLLLAGYLTYINLPSISMRVAAVRAGIAANYPNYSPDGYHFTGPISYKPGEVNISFKSNTNQKGFTISQQASSWDSKAVLDNYVTKKTGTYLTYQERGLTIYSFGDKAAWVNGGLLYTIDGDAPLSSEQLLNIATSM